MCYVDAPHGLCLIFYVQRRWNSFNRDHPVGVCCCVDVVVEFVFWRQRQAGAIIIRLTNMTQCKTGRGKMASDDEKPVKAEIRREEGKRTRMIDRENEEVLAPAGTEYNKMTSHKPKPKVSNIREGTYREGTVGIPAI